jgi:2,4-dienoyl-CoA reductase-like NADH-dependent reductase (Old Yellow Enzyme family)
VNASHPALRPDRIGDLQLANRLAVSPMSRVSAAADGTPMAQMTDYYRAYAQGGFGLVITEGTYTDARYSQSYANQPGIVTGRHLAAWREITDAVHAAGAAIVLQLQHAGALSQGNRHTDVTVAPSAVTPRGQKMSEYGGHGPWPTPIEMSQDDIDAAVRGFADSAARAREAGFDGVEVHGANGYLLDQFLTDYTNLRGDRYGGSVANRARLTAEVVSAIRERAGHDFPVGVRLSQTKVNDFTHRWAGGVREAETVFATLAAAGPAYLHIASEGRDWIETALLDGSITITGLARKVTGLPVIANGGMHDLGQAARVLEEGHADILAIGRGALANPDLPRRLAEELPLAAFDREMLHPMVTLDNVSRWRHGLGADEGER